MPIHWQWYRLQGLSAADVLEMMIVRQQVFVVEQQCIYPDADELDRHSWHLLGRRKGSELVAYARVNPPGSRYREASFGRVLTTAAVRGGGVGRELVRRCIDWCGQHYPADGLRISAQTYLTDFYADFGLASIGRVYDEDGIEHIDMVLGIELAGPSK